MALVSGRGYRSRLNPNAPPFIPAVYRQVEDFSSKCSNLVYNTAWSRDYSMNEHQQSNFDRFNDSKDDDDITNLLPDTFDVGYDEGLSNNMEPEFEGLIGPFETHEGISSFRAEMKPQSGLEFNTGALIKNFNLCSLSPNRRGTSFPVDPVKYNDWPMHNQSPKHGPRSFTGLAQQNGKPFASLLLR